MPTGMTVRCTDTMRCTDTVLASDCRAQLGRVLTRSGMSRLFDITVAGVAKRKDNVLATRCEYPPFKPACEYVLPQNKNCGPIQTQHDFPNLLSEGEMFLRTCQIILFPTSSLCEREVFF